MPKSSIRKKRKPSTAKRKRPIGRKRNKPSDQVTPLGEEVFLLRKVNVDIAQALANPRLEAVLFCEHASQTKDDKTNLSGIFERLYINPITRVSGSFFLFVRVAEATKSLIQITLFDPENMPVFGIGMDVSDHVWTEDYPRIIQYLDRIAFQAKKLGNYWLDVTYEGLSLGGAPLTIDIRPEEKKEEPTHEHESSNA